MEYQKCVASSRSLSLSAFNLQFIIMIFGCFLLIQKAVAFFVNFPHFFPNDISYASTAMKNQHWLI